MAKDRENRYSSIAAMRRDLAICLEEPDGEYVSLPGNMKRRLLPNGGAAGCAAWESGWLWGACRPGSGGLHFAVRLHGPAQQR